MKKETIALAPLKKAIWAVLGMYSQNNQDIKSLRKLCNTVGSTFNINSNTLYFYIKPTVKLINAIIGNRCSASEITRARELITKELEVI